MPKNALVVYNHVARSSEQAELWVGKIAGELSNLGDYIVTVYATSPDKTPKDLIPLLNPTVDLVIAAGGDGTVRFVLSALAEAKSDIPAAIIPLGTGNVLARNLGIVSENFFADPLENAFAAIKNGKPMRIDLGLMNDEYFVVCAGAGPLSDAFVTPERDHKTNFKMFAYVSKMVETIAEPSVVFRITTNGKTFKVLASGVFVGNCEDLGLGKVSDLSALNDGMLDLIVLNPKDFHDYVEIGFRFAGGVIDGDAPLYITKIKEALIEVVPRHGHRSEFQNAVATVRTAITGKESPLGVTEPNIDAMIDGDFSGVTPMRIAIAPLAVNVLVPPAEPKDIILDDDNSRKLNLDLPLQAAPAS